MKAGKFSTSIFHTASIPSCTKQHSFPSQRIAASDSECGQMHLLCTDAFACTEQEQQKGIREYSYLLVVEDLNLLDVVLREDGSGPADRAEVEAAMRLARLGHLG